MERNININVISHVECVARQVIELIGCVKVARPKRTVIHTSRPWAEVTRAQDGIQCTEHTHTQVQVNHHKLPLNHWRGFCWFTLLSPVLGEWRGGGRLLRVGFGRAVCVRLFAGNKQSLIYVVTCWLHEGFVHSLNNDLKYLSLTGAGIE